MCDPACRRVSRGAVTGKTLPTSFLFLSQALGCPQPFLWLLLVHSWAWGLQGKVANPELATLSAGEAEAVTLRPGSSSLECTGTVLRSSRRAPAFLSEPLPFLQRTGCWDLSPLQDPSQVCTFLCFVVHVPTLCVHSDVCTVVCVHGGTEACVQKLLLPHISPRAP